MSVQRRYILLQSRTVVAGWQYALARLLFPLVRRDYRLREAGKRPDRWHWADKVLVRLGFGVIPQQP